VDISAAGAGQIQFPATQNASANANTLDDYEEGTFTPTFFVGGTEATYSSQIGYYTKIGRVITITIFVATTSINGATGVVSLKNFPFDTINSQGARGGSAVGYYTGFTTTPYYMSDSGSTSGNFRRANGSDINNTDIGNSNSVYMTYVYMTN
jgi:hypothetical protein